MPVKYADIEFAFDFVCSGQMYTHQAFLNKETGKVYWYSEYGDYEEELPDDLDDDKYIEIPHKNELDLGKTLVFDFVYQYLPSEIQKVENFFRGKGAYGKFKNLIERKDVLEKWYQFSDQAHDVALRAWCKVNKIEVED